eukprot:g14270.t1
MRFVYHNCCVNQRDREVLINFEREDVPVPEDWRPTLEWTTESGEKHLDNKLDMREFSPAGNTRKGCLAFKLRSPINSIASCFFSAGTMSISLLQDIRRDLQRQAEEAEEAAGSAAQQQHHQAHPGPGLQYQSGAGASASTSALVSSGSTSAAQRERGEARAKMMGYTGASYPDMLHHKGELASVILVDESEGEGDEEEEDNESVAPLASSGQGSGAQLVAGLRKNALTSMSAPAHLVSKNGIAAGNISNASSQTSLQHYMQRFGANNGNGERTPSPCYDWDPSHSRTSPAGNVAYPTFAYDQGGWGGLSAPHQNGGGSSPGRQHDADAYTPVASAATGGAQNPYYVIGGAGGGGTSGGNPNPGASGADYFTASEPPSSKSTNPLPPQSQPGALRIDQSAQYNDIYRDGEQSSSSTAKRKFSGGAYHNHPQPVVGAGGVETFYQPLSRNQSRGAEFDQYGALSAGRSDHAYRGRDRGYNGGRNSNRRGDGVDSATGDHYDHNFYRGGTSSRGSNASSQTSLQHYMQRFGANNGNGERTPSPCYDWDPSHSRTSPAGNFAYPTFAYDQGGWGGLSAPHQNGGGGSPGRQHDADAYTPVASAATGGAQNPYYVIGGAAGAPGATSILVFKVVLAPTYGAVSAPAIRTAIADGRRMMTRLVVRTSHVPALATQRGVKKRVLSASLPGG